MRKRFPPVMFLPGVKVVPALGGTELPADSASEIVKFTISIPRESCTNAKAKYSSRPSVVPSDPSVHFYHWFLPQSVKFQ